MILKIKTERGWLVVPQYLWFAIDSGDLHFTLLTGETRDVTGVKEVYLMGDDGVTIDKIM